MKNAIDHNTKVEAVALVILKGLKAGEVEKKLPVSSRSVRRWVKDVSLLEEVKALTEKEVAVEVEAAPKKENAEPKADKKASKADKAREIFDRIKDDGLARKDVIELFVEEAGLSKAGAATYYYNIKKMHSKAS